MKLFILSVKILVCLFSCDVQNWSNVDHLRKVKIGDTKQSVIEKMQAQPDEIVENNTIYIDQKEIVPVTTFVFHTPSSASSEIFLHFSANDSLIWIQHDL